MSLIDGAYALIATRPRAIGTLIPDVTIEETHVDQIRITDHPVETGASVSDHAFKMPETVEMRVGWSNSTGGYTGYVQTVYDELVRLQNMREPMTVYTGSRVYRDMLIETISKTTDQKSEFALMCSVSLRRIILTSTSGSGSFGTSANPSNNDPVETAGRSTPTPVPGRTLPDTLAPVTGGSNIPQGTVLG